MSNYNKSLLGNAVDKLPRTVCNVLMNLLVFMKTKSFRCSPSLFATFILCSILLAACNKKQASEERKVTSGTTQTLQKKSGKNMEELLKDFEQQNEKERIGTANLILDIIYQEEITDSLLKVTTHTPADSVELLVWYWASEHFWDKQDYNESMRCVMKALPLTYRIGNQESQSDCEQLMGQIHFRRSDFVHALEHVNKSLEIDRKMGDKSRISSSLNTLAAICLTAKQPKDSEHYILEAISYSTAAQDSNRMAIQYGIASEVYHTLGKERLALNYAQRAYIMDSILGNTEKMGIRLSQMAAAQMAMRHDGDAERLMKRALPMLEKEGYELSLSVCRNQMGELLNRRGAHAEAAQLLRKSAESCEKRQDVYNESRARKGLYEALKGTNLAEADKHLVRYVTLQDSIYHHEMEQAVSQNNVKYKTEELAFQQERERAEKRFILLGGIASIVVLLLVMGILIYSGRVRRRNHRILKRMSALRENFFTNITHEFRTPLAVILGLSHDLQTVETDGVKEKAQVIERQGNGLLRLINQLLDISKVKSEVGNPDWFNGNITVYFEMIIESWNEYARNKNIDLQYFSKDTVEMDFVPDYANKLINNLLSNAFKFTPEYGKVSVIVWRKDNHLLIDVADTGSGMDKETIEHVFEPFYQSNNNSHNIGSGVGMALVKQIIDVVEGSITVESKPEKGTTFHISIPIRNNCKRQLPIETVTNNNPILPETGKMPADSEKGDNECNLLIIEDNHDIAAYIGSQFADEYAVSYASNGREGLEKALELVPDLIITDLMMPEMDGLEVCRQVRKNEIISHIPIIIVTAKITDKERIEGIEAGADAYLIKPFSSDELRTWTEKLLAGRRLLQQKFATMSAESEESEESSTTLKREVELHFINKVTDFIYMQIGHSKDISVSRLASNMCMSERQFYRKINALTGYTPSAYIQHLKIKRACNMLDRNPNISFVEVADRCGFDAYPNFVRAFRQVCGVTPTDYRKERTAPDD